MGTAGIDALDAERIDVGRVEEIDTQVIVEVAFPVREKVASAFTFLQYSLEAQHGADFEATYCVTDIPRFVREHPTSIVGAFTNRPISAS